MNESENYLDQLLNAVDSRSDLNDSDPVNPEEIESKEQMPQKSTRETIDIPNTNDLFMDQFEQELRKDDDPDEFLKQFEKELDRDESSQGVTKAAQPMLDNIDQIMESVNQEAANDTAEMAASAVEKTAEQKEDTAEVKNDEDASEDGIDDLAIDDIGIDDFGLDDPETENEKAVSDEDDELMRILSGTGEDSEIPEADNAKAEAEAQPDDGVKEEKKPKKQGFLAKLSKLLFGDDEPDEEEISGMQAEPAVAEMPMDDMDILKELEASSDGDKKGKKEKKKKEKKKKEKAPDSEKKNKEYIAKKITSVAEKEIESSTPVYKQPTTTTTGDGSSEKSLEDMTSDADKFLNSGNAPSSTFSASLQNFSKTIYNIMLTIGIFLAVIIGGIIGIKLMVSSASEKAEVKKLLVPYVVGCVVVFGGFGIWKLVVTILQGI